MFRATTTGTPSLEHLRGQVEVAVEVGGVDDGEDDVGPRLAGWLPEEQIDRDHLVRAAGGQAVGAGQVDQVEGSVADARPCPFFISTVTPG